MKTTNKKPISKAPQRRKRGTTIRTAPTISATPRASVPGSVSAEVTRNSASACDQTNGSVSFQAPETKNRIARSTAQTPPMTFFHAGKSRLARSRPKCAGFAVVSDIDTPFYRNPGGTLSPLGRGEELLGNVHRPPDILLRVGRRDETGLELRWRQINSPIQHPVEKLPKPCDIGAFGRFPVRYRIGRKEKGEHRPHAVHRNSRRHIRGKLRRAAFDNFIDLSM